MSGSSKQRNAEPARLDRGRMLRRLADARRPWDVLIIGGGATGLGCALDAASRGYRTALVERGDFAQGTSSRSTKLVHGGVRYLQQGNVSLVLEALHERGLLRRNAPHLVHDLAFVVPNYDWWEAPFYGIGLRVYDMLAGKHGFGKSRNLSRAETLERLPTIETEGLRGGVLYYDGQFDDARLAIHLAMTAADLGATLVNYVEVTGLRHDDGLVRGVEARDVETGDSFEIGAAVVVNATGAFTDGVRRMDDPRAKPMIRPSQGVHLVLPAEFLPSEHAIMVPHTDDGRVLFAIPWHGRVVVGTTDTPISETPIEPVPMEEEVEFLLEHAARYLSKDPTRADVAGVFAGVRPLVGSLDDEDSAALSRDHTIHIAPSGLLTVAGGKWTTYRKMAEDAVDHAAVLGRLPERPCRTGELELHGYHPDAESFGDLAVYGADATLILDLAAADASLAGPVHEAVPMTGAEVIWAVRHEMARRVEDVLSRRRRWLLLDARGAMAAARAVAELMAVELGRDVGWVAAEVESFEALAAGYLPAVAKGSR